MDENSERIAVSGVARGVVAALAFFMLVIVVVYAFFQVV